MAAIDLELAMVEAANNIVEHGGVTGAEGITLEFAVDRGVAVVTLIDHGRPVPQGLYNQCRDTPTDAEDGRGAGIVRACVDAIQYASADGINRLTLTKLLL